VTNKGTRCASQGGRIRFSDEDGRSKLLSMYKGKDHCAGWMYTTRPHCQKVATSADEGTDGVCRKGRSGSGAAFIRVRQGRVQQFNKCGTEFPVGYSEQGTDIEFLAHPGL